jgi:inosine/xanthosine triphosphatase
MKVAIGTKNPTKINAIKAAFVDMEATMLAFSVESGVSPQPFSDSETIQGAINRARNSFHQEKVDLGVGLEGGVVETDYGLFLCNWGAIIDKDDNPIIAGGAKILLPPEFEVELKNGRELGDVMKDYTKKQDIRTTEGAIGTFTNGLINRTEMFTHVAKLLVGQYLYKVRMDC